MIFNLQVTQSSGLAGKLFSLFPSAVYFPRAFCCLVLYPLQDLAQIDFWQFLFFTLVCLNLWNLALLTDLYFCLSSSCKLFAYILRLYPFKGYYIFFNILLKVDIYLHKCGIHFYKFFFRMRVKISFLFSSSDSRKFLSPCTVKLLYNLSPTDFTNQLP